MSKNIAVSKIEGSKFNPPQRTSASALVALKEDIQRRGILSPVHVIPGDDGGPYVLIDGHRRVSVARDIGLTHVEACVHEDVSLDDAVHLWSSLNRTSRSINGKEWLGMWWLAGPKSEKSLPPIIRSQIKECMVIFGGRDGVKILIEKNQSPAIVHAIHMTHKLITSKPSLRELESDERTIGLWLIKHRASGFIHGTFSRAGAVPFGVIKKLAKRIKNDQPMTIADIASRSARVE